MAGDCQEALGATTCCREKPQVSGARKSQDHWQGQSQKPSRPQNHFVPTDRFHILQMHAKMQCPHFLLSCFGVPPCHASANKIEQIEYDFRQSNWLGAPRLQHAHRDPSIRITTVNLGYSSDPSGA